MKTKKILFTVLTVALVTAFIIGCITPLDNTNPGTVKKKVSVPEGKTLVTLNLGSAKPSGRAAHLPVTSAYSDVTDFTHFKVKVFNEDDQLPVIIGAKGSVFPIADIYNSGTDTWDFDIELDANVNYEFTIYAYDNTGPGSTNNPVAWGVGSKLIDPSASGSDSIDLTLHEIFEDAVGTDFTGDMSWSFTLGSSSISSLSLVSSDGSTISLSTSATGTKTDLEPGKYDLIIGLSRAGYESAYVREKVYIYSGFETIVSGVTLPTLRSNHYTVTFNSGADTLNDINGTVLTGGLDHGSNILQSVTDFFNSTNFPGITTPGKPDHSGGPGMHFDKWYYFVSGAQGDLVGAIDKIINNIVLLATWEADQYSFVDMSGFTLLMADNTPPASADFTGSEGVYNITTQTLDLTLSADVSGAEYYKWFYGSDTTGVPLSSSSTVTLNYSLHSGVVGYTENDIWFQTGTHIITLDTGNATYEFTFLYPPPGP